MQSAGADVLTFRGDVTRRMDVDAVLERIGRDMPRLRGIVHAAAVLADRTLLEMGEAEFFRAMEPKVFGAWNLHEATQKNQLDFFILYSAAAGLLGSPGQANYASANAFLDALSRSRSANGLASMSIQWGPFADVGLAAVDDIRGKRLASRGSASFTPNDGNILFERILGQHQPAVGLLHFDVRQWLEFYPQMAGAPFFTELLSDQRTPDHAGRMRLRDELEHLNPPQRAMRIETHLLEQLSRVLRVEPDKIDKRTPFTNLGMDSLMSVELRNRLEASLGFKLPAALLFTYSTTASLTSHLTERTLQDLSPSPQIAPVVELVRSDSAAPVESADDHAEEVDEAALIDKLSDFEEYLNE
jgi:acyl carrier protein